MQNTQKEILDSEDQEKPKLRRRDLLPWWIKIFTWIFLIFGAIIPVAILVGLFGYQFNLSLYGQSTTEPFSMIGIVVMFLFSLKAVTAFGLWTEKDWAVFLGQIDTVLGILICIVDTIFTLVSGFSQSSLSLNIRLELLLLIPFLIKLRKIRADWNSSGNKAQNSNFA